MSAPWFLADRTPSGVLHCLLCDTATPLDGEHRCPCGVEDCDQLASLVVQTGRLPEVPRCDRHAAFVLAYAERFGRTVTARAYPRTRTAAITRTGLRTV